ncbi:hypothetical protein BS78_K013900 [Paspalum vaginatum]|uniref:Chlororespiratory reduction 42 n=1 Tax=Paspalum vaginatum TaxID=158149 RepID=A0A9W7XDD8_9POAL|nr:hypothetical protein BS78_K013900 [Paspalum vaginatum]
MLRPLLAAATAAVSSPLASLSPRQQVVTAAAPAPARRRRPGGGSVAIQCAPNGGMPAGDTKSKLKVGSPIVILEAPVMLKTAASVPSLRHNNNQVKAGDVGRIVAWRPKDVWAVRLAVGTYLLDGKFFSPLDSDDSRDDDDGGEPPDE